MSGSDSNLYRELLLQKYTVESVLNSQALNTNLSGHDARKLLCKRLNHNLERPLVAIECTHASLAKFKFNHIIIAPNTALRTSNNPSSWGNRCIIISVADLNYKFINLSPKQIVAFHDFYRWVVLISYRLIAVIDVVTKINFSYNENAISHLISSIKGSPHLLATTAGMHSIVLRAHFTADYYEEVKSQTNNSANDFILITHDWLNLSTDHRCRLVNCNEYSHKMNDLGGPTLVICLHPLKVFFLGRAEQVEIGHDLLGIIKKKNNRLLSEAPVFFTTQMARFDKFRSKKEKRQAEANAIRSADIPNCFDNVAASVNRDSRQHQANSDAGMAVNSAASGGSTSTATQPVTLAHATPDGLNNPDHVSRLRAGSLDHSSSASFSSQPTGHMDSVSQRLVENTVSQGPSQANIKGLKLPLGRNQSLDAGVNELFGHVNSRQGHSARQGAGGASSTSNGHQGAGNNSHTSPTASSSGSPMTGTNPGGAMTGGANPASPMTSGTNPGGSMTGGASPGGAMPGGTNPGSPVHDGSNPVGASTGHSNAAFSEGSNGSGANSGSLNRTDSQTQAFTGGDQGPGEIGGKFESVSDKVGSASELTKTATDQGNAVSGSVSNIADKVSDASEFVSLGSTIVGAVGGVGAVAGAAIGGLGMAADGIGLVADVVSVVAEPKNPGVTQGPDELSVSEGKKSQGGIDEGRTGHKTNLSQHPSGHQKGALSGGAAVENSPGHSGATPLSSQQNATRADGSQMSSLHANSGGSAHVHHGPTASAAKSSSTAFNSNVDSGSGLASPAGGGVTNKPANSQKGVYLSAGALDFAPFGQRSEPLPLSSAGVADLKGRRVDSAQSNTDEINKSTRMLGVGGSMSAMAGFGAHNSHSDVSLPDTFSDADVGTVLTGMKPENNKTAETQNKANEWQIPFAKVKQFESSVEKNKRPESLHGNQYTEPRTHAYLSSDTLDDTDKKAKKALNDKIRRSRLEVIDTHHATGKSYFHMLSTTGQMLVTGISDFNRSVGIVANEWANNEARYGQNLINTIKHLGSYEGNKTPAYWLAQFRQDPVNHSSWGMLMAAFVAKITDHKIIVLNYKAEVLAQVGRDGFCNAFNGRKIDAIEKIARGDVIGVLGYKQNNHEATRFLRIKKTDADAPKRSLKESFV